jgi:predicted pyridoxine 5'-phosphate oxidase superfamily flavin-nucleotide-binding protein
VEPPAKPINLLRGRKRNSYIAKLCAISFRGSAMRIPAEIKEMINEKARAPRIHFATSARDGKPNVVPIGYVEVISDEEVLIVDTLMGKTRENLEENPQVAIAVEVMEEFRAYQLKGKANIFTEGNVFEKALETQKRRDERRRLRYAREWIKEPVWARELHQRKPKSRGASQGGRNILHS